MKTAQHTPGAVRAAELIVAQFAANLPPNCEISDLMHRPMQDAMTANISAIIDRETAAPDGDYWIAWTISRLHECDYVDNDHPAIDEIVEKLRRARKMLAHDRAEATE